MLRITLFIAVFFSVLGCNNSTPTNPNPQNPAPGAGIIPGGPNPPQSQNVFTSPQVEDIVKAAGPAANGKVLVIGNAKVSFPKSNKVAVEFEYRVLKKGIRNKSYTCRITSAQGARTSVHIPEVSRFPKDASGVKTGNAIIVPGDFSPPFTFVVQEHQFLGKGIEVSNKLVFP